MSAHPTQHHPADRKKAREKILKSGAHIKHFAPKDGVARRLRENIQSSWQRGGRAGAMQKTKHFMHTKQAAHVGTLERKSAQLCPYNVLTMESSLLLKLVAAKARSARTSLKLWPL